MGEKKQAVTLEDLYGLLEKVNTNLSSKIDNVYQELISSMKNTNEKVRILEEKVVQLETENKLLKGDLENLDRKLRNSNLIFYGIEETGDEIESVKGIIRDILQIRIDNYDITNVHRLGKANGKVRPVLVKLHSELKRGEILANCSKLKNTRIFVTKDLIHKDLETRRILIHHLKLAKAEKKEARIKGNRLVVEGTEYTAENLASLGQQSSELSYHFSPPPTRRANSEPSTPSPDMLCEYSEIADISKIVVPASPAPEVKESKPVETNKELGKEVQRRYGTRHLSSSGTSATPKKTSSRSGRVNKNI